MLQAIAIDDEPMALEVIKTLAAHVVFMELKACFTNAFEAAEYLQKTKVDLVFLDIKMPTISGIDFLKTIPDPPMVIFTTAYSEHAVQSFELDAIDYLLKPFSLPRFLKACNKALKQHELQANSGGSTTSLSSVFIKSGYEQVKVELADVLYAESAGNYMQFALTDRNIVSRLTMSDVEALLPQTHFIRVHRSFIVSARHITKTDKNSVWIGNKEIPIGAAYTSELEKLIHKNKKT
ncbi:MAG TPA: LytTR family DNA-binding domain-containing protein [Mucilaginibacter sp.]|jgi:DNA-binding LytR/AlgR family response regulator|nr:LytTR family DNA-binding domain-containing protein [Mucilaginibacter sp.]